MKTFSKFIIVVLLGLLTVACNTSPAPSYIENGVNLGKGIPVLGDWKGDGNLTTLYWAPVNCGYEEVGEVNTDSDHRLGKLYQWGAGDASLPCVHDGEPVVAREMYYDDPVSETWYTFDFFGGDQSDTWNNNQGPCPDGWRLPTQHEFDVLAEGEYTAFNDRGPCDCWVEDGTYAGQMNTYVGVELWGANADKVRGKGLFLPASGHSIVGHSEKRGLYGCYWTSTCTDWLAFTSFLQFSSSSLVMLGCLRSTALSVRCVTE